MARIYVLYPSYNADGYHEPLAASTDRQKLVSYLRDEMEVPEDSQDDYDIQEVTIL